jgi:hypothetical protein
MVRSQTRQIVHETSISKITSQNGLECGLSGREPTLQEQSSQFKHQLQHKKKKKRERENIFSQGNKKSFYVSTSFCLEF